MFNFGKNKNQPVVNSRAIYEPEVIDERLWRYSTWRKPVDLNTASRFHIEKYIRIERKITKIIDYLVMFLSVLVVLCFAKLIFFTDYEKAVLTDGTQLSCVIDPQGNLSPYTPPRIETKVLKNNPVHNSSPAQSQ